ncbi:MAG: hypothetical protein JWO53_74 [Chlamydiia bacterium]|nr:hypothetical protein [Chlamydiia bacterium]
MKRINIFGPIVVLFAVFYSPAMNGCTDFLLKADDGTPIASRSMEFGIPLDSTIAVHPRGEQRSSDAPNSQKGLQWTSQYGFVAATAFHLDIAVDGMNEKGLSFGFLWLPGSEYESVTPHNSSQALAVEDLGSWILGNFATVQEVKLALGNVIVWGKSLQQIKMAPPVHVAIHDAQGNSLVVEFIGGVKKLYDNKVGVLTNAPQFEWHVENLRNYLNLKAVSESAIDFNGTVLSPAGQGSGLLGIPGDWMPSSRFVRMTVFKEFTKKPQDAKTGVNVAFHLLNTVDIPFGANGTEEKGNAVFDYTQWAVVKDLKNKRFYWRTYENLNIQSIDLDTQNLEAGAKVKTISVL